jgi:hypothetical protein
MPSGWVGSKETKPPSGPTVYGVKTCSHFGWPRPQSGHHDVIKHPTSGIVIGHLRPRLKSISTFIFAGLTNSSHSQYSDEEDEYSDEEDEYSDEEDEYSDEEDEYSDE